MRPSTYQKVGAEYIPLVLGLGTYIGVQMTLYLILILAIAKAMTAFRTSPKIT